MDEHQFLERLVRLETKQDALEQSVREFFKSSVEDRAALRASVARIEARLEKQMSFIGGVVFVVSGLWGVFLLFKDWFLSLVRG